MNPGASGKGREVAYGARKEGEKKEKKEKNGGVAGTSVWEQGGPGVVVGR